MTTEIIPFGKRIVVEPMTSLSSDHWAGIGTVVRLGTGRFARNGQHLSYTFRTAPGDLVLFPASAGTQFSNANKRYLIIDEDDLLGYQAPAEPPGCS